MLYILAGCTLFLLTDMVDGYYVIYILAGCTMYPLTDMVDGYYVIYFGGVYTVPTY